MDYGHERVNSALLESAEPGLVISIRSQPLVELPGASGPRVQLSVTVCIPASVYVSVCSGAPAPSLLSHLYFTVMAALV